MADREQSHTTKRTMTEKPRRDTAIEVGQPHGGGTAGHDAPDSSKEHNTEIAVEAGRKGQRS